MSLYAVFFLLLAAVLAMLLWPVRRQKLACAIVCVVFFIGAFSIYAMVGSPEIIPMLKARDAKLAELKAAIIKNSDAIKTNPKNLSAWVELGQSFMETGQYGAAANAFKQSVLLSQGDPELILAYARSMIASDDGKVSDQSKKSLEMVLLQEPKNPEVRYFLTVRKLQDGHTQDAMKDMKALYRSLPEGSPVKDMIDRQIGRN